ncbi:MAG: hypothetical protein H6617_10085 [Bdellovibrionaceae bacterium]|nr:hypothetical protein [Bdellovibrionales bacterium]MCB9255019.1 hypothetical protein [Pseudobdellovibrionaceae bacterium]
MKFLFLLFSILFVSLPALADVVAYPGAENEKPLTWASASCEWKGKDLVLDLGKADEKPRVRITLKAFDDYTAYLQKNKKMELKLYNEGFGDVLYKDIDGFERSIPNHVKEANCNFSFTDVEYDGNFLVSFVLSFKCEGFRKKGTPFQRSLEVRKKDPILCKF